MRPWALLLFDRPEFTVIQQVWRIRHTITCRLRKRALVRVNGVRVRRSVRISAQYDDLHALDGQHGEQSQQQQQLQQQQQEPSVHFVFQPAMLWDG